jgi:hypothetical protein
LKSEPSYNDNSFEKWLKHHTDDFVLYPKKKVWYSIYNNIHPARKWPSIGTSIILLACLFWLGATNTGNVKKATYSISVETNQMSSILLADKKIEIKVLRIQNKATGKEEKKYIKINTFKAKSFLLKSHLTTAIKQPDIIIFIEKKFHSDFIDQMQNVKTASPIPNQDMFEIEPIHLNDSTTSHLLENNLKRELKDITSASIKNDLTIDIKKEAIPNPEENKSVSKNHSKKTLRPKQIQFYFTPNVSYRTLRLNEKIVNESAVLKNMINQSPSAGIEMGLTTKSSIFKKISII